MSDYLNKAKDKVITDIEKMTNFNGTQQERIIEVWHLRNRARRICNKLGDRALQNKAESLLNPDQQYLFDLLDKVYNIGYRDGLGY